MNILFRIVFPLAGLMLMSCSGGDGGVGVENVAEPGVDSGTQENPPQRMQVDVLVSLKGRDEVNCGALLTPCRSVEYAVETRAQAG